MEAIDQAGFAHGSETIEPTVVNIADVHWPENAAEDLAAQINRDGYACLPAIMPASLVAEARAQAERAVENNLGEYVSFMGQNGLSGYLLQDLHADRRFLALCKAICASGLNIESTDADFYQILRCLKGKTAAHHSNYLHYDSYCLTALFPIAMPERGAGGELLVFPSQRPIRKSYWVSAIEKAIIDLKPVQRLLNAGIRRKLLKPLRLTLEPGSVYFFWGYRSLHTNDRCASSALRATALLHYANPHQNSTTSTLRKTLRIFSRRVPTG